MLFTNVSQLFVCLREGRYTSVGSYPTYFAMADGEVMCHGCVRAEIWQVARNTRLRCSVGEGIARHARSDEQWSAIGVDANWEDPDMHCAHCGERIQLAYAEDASETVESDVERYLSASESACNRSDPSEAVAGVGNAAERLQSVSTLTRRDTQRLTRLIKRVESKVRRVQGAEAIWVESATRKHFTYTHKGCVVITWDRNERAYRVSVGKSQLGKAVFFPFPDDLEGAKAAGLKRLAEIDLDTL